MLEVTGLSVSYGKHRALENISLRVNRGEIVVILGANGAGKSTLLKSISGICEGRVTGIATMEGTELVGLAPNRIVEQGIALVPEGRGVFGDLTVQENLTLGAYSERAREEEHANVARVMQLFPKLAERRRQVVRTMSGGEQQMVAIGRAMMSNPQLLTLDEPSLGLSPLLCKELFQSLRAVRDTGIGILLVEQNAKQSLAIADRGYLLENGEIVHQDTAEALCSDPAVQRAYLGGGGTATGISGKAGSKPADPARRVAPAATPAAGSTRPTSPTPSQAPRPRPSSGETPADIAAAALAKLPAKPSRPEPPRVRTSEAPPPARHPSPEQPPAAPSQAPAQKVRPTRSAADALLGVSIDDLVTRAGEASRARHGTTTPARPPRGPAVASGRPRMPDLSADFGDSSDRLKSILSEIEEAAARARAYRPDPHRK